MPGTDKGVSPLIATVILIAFVVAVAAIASQFLTGFSQERASQVEREGEETVDCSLAALEIDPDSVTHNAGSDELLLTIENTGREDLGIPEIVYSNTTDEIREVALATRHSDDTEITTSDPLEEGEVLTIHNTTVVYRPSDITVRTSCAGVTAAVTNDTDTDELDYRKV